MDTCCPTTTSTLALVGVTPYVVHSTALHLALAPATQPTMKCATTNFLFPSPIPASAPAPTPAPPSPSVKAKSPPAPVNDAHCALSAFMLNHTKRPTVRHAIHSDRPELVCGYSHEVNGTRPRQNFCPGVNVDVDVDVGLVARAQRGVGRRVSSVCSGMSRESDVSDVSKG